MVEAVNRTWRERSLAWGLIAGGLTVAWLVLFYLIDPELMLRTEVLMATYFFYFLGMYKSAIPERSAELKDYLRPAFLTFVIANVLYYAFHYVMFVHVAPSLIDLQAAQLEAAGRLGEIGGREALAVTLGATVLTYFSSLLGGFILAALLAFVLRNR